MVTMSPESMVSTGFTVARKYPMCTVFGLGMSVCAAARAAETPTAVTNNSAQAMVVDACRLRILRTGEGTSIKISSRQNKADAESVWPTADDVNDGEIQRA